MYKRTSLPCERPRKDATSHPLCSESTKCVCTLHPLRSESAEGVSTSHPLRSESAEGISTSHPLRSESAKGVLTSHPLRSESAGGETNSKIPPYAAMTAHLPPWKRNPYSGDLQTIQDPTVLYTISFSALFWVTCKNHKSDNNPHTWCQNGGPPEANCRGKPWI